MVLGLILLLVLLLLLPLVLGRGCSRRFARCAEAGAGDDAERGELLLKLQG